MGATVIRMPGILLQDRKSIYQDIVDIARSYFGNNIMLSGINDESVGLATNMARTYAISLPEIPQYDTGHDILDYAQDLILVYDADKLEPTDNEDHMIEGDPKEAILGALRLGW